MDRCDQELHKLFAQRSSIIAEVAQYKKAQGLPIYDPAREEMILTRYGGLEREFFRHLLLLSRRQQSELLFPYGIVLIGFMGVGKTSVGRSLAIHLGREFVDLDERIEKYLGMTIGEYFRTHGENAFRVLEKTLIQELPKDKKIVLATGGGAILDQSNVTSLQELGRLVLLTATPETIYERLKENALRPILGPEVTPERIREILEKREPLYLGASQHLVITDQYSVEEVVANIVQLLLQFERE